LVRLDFQEPSQQREDWIYGFHTKQTSYVDKINTNT